MDNGGFCASVTVFCCASGHDGVITSLSKTDTHVSEFHITSRLGALSRARGSRRGRDNAEGEAQVGESSAKEVAEVREELYEQDRQNFDHFHPIWRR